MFDSPLIEYICVLDSYIKAEDPSNYAEAIEVANRVGKQDDLVRYLQMARETLRRLKVDTELAYSKTDRLRDMEDFLGFTNIAGALGAGGKCFNDELYQAAKLIFANWALLAGSALGLGSKSASGVASYS
jgi:clathrin heavy chain